LSATPEQHAAIDRILEGRGIESAQRCLDSGQEGVAATGTGATAEPFVTKAEVAKRLNRDVRTITTWMGKGLLPFYRIEHSVVFKWSEVEQQLAVTCRVSRPRCGGAR
jgi:hypothetical protein